MTRDDYERVRALILDIVGHDDPMSAINTIRELLHELSPVTGQPVDFVRWVPIDDVVQNQYNPNSVAVKEMALLLTSILADNYTQPVVTVWDPDLAKFVVVDGFHRYFVCKHNEAVRDRTHGLLPIVVLEGKTVEERMAATVRHNRARGKHSVQGMAKMVFEMLDMGKTEADICNELGMEPEEVNRLKHITGFSKLFEDTEYSRTWVTRHMILANLKRKAAEDAASAMSST